MKRFVEGEDRRQATLLPECLDDYVAPDNPVRIIEAFVDELDLAALGFAGVVPEATGRPGLSSRHPAQDLHLRLSQPRPLQPPPGAGDPAQPRADLADRPPDAGLQDHCRLPPRQRPSHPRGVCAVHRAVPQAQPVHPGSRRARRLQVQGGQQPRQELHRRQGGQAHRAGRGRHRTLSRRAGSRRPAAWRGDARPGQPASSRRSRACAGRCSL